jgi:hypothetical protein
MSLPVFLADDQAVVYNEVAVKKTMHIHVILNRAQLRYESRRL